jgi:hypothetical protein
MELETENLGIARQIFRVTGNSVQIIGVNIQ